jgi:hypothetical protein
MELKIDREVLELADQCDRGHRCLTGELCEAEVVTVGPERFLCHDPVACAYKFPFGGSFFCTCPVRWAIYYKYGK